MADDALQLDPDGTGKKVDNESLVGVGGATVYRQRVQLTGAALAEVARVQNTDPAGTEYGAVTRNVPVNLTARKFKSISLAATGDMVAAVTSKKIRVLALMLNNASAADGTVAIRSSTTSTICAVLTIRQGAGFVLPYSEVGWMETVAGESLNALITTITQLSGVLVYVEV